MPKTQKVAMLLILLCATACASKPPEITLGLGPITCPPSLTVLEGGEEAIDPEFIARLSEEDQRYILQREAGWENSLDRANSKAVDGLQACADYNEALRQR